METAAESVPDNSEECDMSRSWLPDTLPTPEPQVTKVLTHTTIINLPFQLPWEVALHTAHNSRVLSQLLENTW